MMIRYRPLPINFTRYVLTIQYFGSSFRGWQESDSDVEKRKDTRKKGIRSLYSVLHDSLTQFAGVDHFRNLKISSRTDIGVHALRNTCQGMYISF